MKIAVPITASTLGGALALIRKAERAKADFIEVRLDYLRENENLQRILNSTKLKTIATNRPVWEGGRFKGSEEDRVQTLIEAAKMGFEYVDIELTAADVKRAVKEIRETGAKPIVSFHNFNGTPKPAELKRILEEEIRVGAKVCKIVTMANKVEDNLTILSFVSAASEKAKVVCFNVGELGLPSRILSPIFGGYFTFAAVERGRESASGQLTIAEMKEIYRMMRVA